jgi:dihydrofolate synthase/folylpolyglutamate synthase
MFAKLPMYQNIGASAYKKDISNIISICNHLDNPQNKFKSIHVGGTNGKGSTSHMLSSILQESGYKVGLYTSPHLVDFRERIRVNGEMIPKESVEDFMNHNLDFFNINNFSFFEMTVGLAFNYFNNQNVDIAIIEVGMGGRLDSTNIINPILSIITNISIDHTKFLGNNISDIAHEKAGIIKPGIPVVIGETQEEIKDIFIETALENDSEISFADNFKTKEFDCDLKGEYQTKNISTVQHAVTKIQSMGYKINDMSIENGLLHVVKNTSFMGRWQVIQSNPLVICDTGHNEAALKELVAQMISSNHSKYHFILGFSNDKNIEKISKIFPKDGSYYFVKPNVGRGMDANEVKKIFFLNNRIGKSFNSSKEALSEAHKYAKQNDFVFIGGSTFVVSEVI